MRRITLILSLSGCPKNAPAPIPAPEPPAIEAASRAIETSVDLAGARGIPATVIGRLERRSPPGEVGEGTAIVLADGAAVFVSEHPPPLDWEWLLGTRVRIQGLLWERPEAGWQVPKLLEAETPMPADVSILLEP